MSDLPWRVAWITGASTGIGRELAIALAKRGVIVAASARSADKLAELGHGVRAYPLDVTDARAVIATHDRIYREIGPIDLAVLAAGTYKPLHLAEFDTANFIETSETDWSPRQLTAPLLARLALALPKISTFTPITLVKGEASIRPAPPKIEPKEGVAASRPPLP